MTSISARLRAIEESLQKDQSDDESFDYNEFMLKRNQEVSKDHLTVDEIRAQLEHIEEEPEPEVVANSRQVVIDSDSEDQIEDAVESGAEQSEHDESDLEDEDGAPSPPSSTRDFLKSTKPRDPASNLESKYRKSRVNAEKELASMRRKLDLDIEIYTKRAPTVSEFITKFKKPISPPKDEQDSDDLEIVDDVPTPLLPQNSDPRAKLFTDLFKMNRQQIREQEMIKKKKWAERNGILDDGQNEEDLSDSQVSEVEDTIENVQTSDKSLSNAHDDPSENEDSEDQPASSLASSQVTEVNETQVEAPIDPQTLRKLYRQQQKIFNDSDSDSDAQDSELESEDPQVADKIDRDNLDQLSPSQQYEELRRRHQQKREAMLQMLEQQAQESDEEGGDVALSDDEDDDDGPPVENLIDDTKQDVHEQELHAKFVEAEREMDEYVTNVIRRDVVNGGWRSKNLYDETGMLQDDVDDLDEETLKRREKIRKSLLKNDAAGKFIKDPKMRMYAEAIVDSYMPEKQTNVEVFDSVEDCFTSMFGTNEAPSSSPSEHVEMLPTPPQVASSLPKSAGISGSSRGHRDSVLTRALPTVHAVPRLATTHVVKRRAKLSEPTAKTPKLSVKPIGLGY